jgi:hypothetical protein
MFNTTLTSALQAIKPAKKNLNLYLNDLDKFKFLATMIDTMQHLKSSNKLMLLSSCGFFDPKNPAGIYFDIEITS